MKTHRIEQYGMVSPVKIRELETKELVDFKPVPSEVLENRWVCLKDIVEALKAPEPWSDPTEAYRIAEQLEENLDV